MEARPNAEVTALASSSGDHAELAMMANAALEIYSDDVLVVGGTRRIHADNIILYVKNGVDALLAENAALRERPETARFARVEHNRQYEELRSRATEAKRKLAEAEQVIREISETAQITRVRHLARTFLNKETERG